MSHLGRWKNWIKMHKTTQSVTYRVLQDRQARAERGLQEIPAHELQSSRIMSRIPYIQIR